MTFVVESSPDRSYSDSEYEEAGISVSEDISDADVFFWSEGSSGDKADSKQDLLLFLPYHKKNNATTGNCSVRFWIRIFG
ncbi:hypothetical protein [Algoriphagus boritolerans]|uniref:hypothetical protein n=1 Tax=Algoriphagus boritolerans TaxID=308111 RepID=UPI002FCE50C4